jgi:hypothetical protein
MPVSRKTAQQAGAAVQPPSMEWTGWWRPRGGQWQPLVSGSTYDEAWRGLYREMDKGRSGDWVVLRLGKRP